MIYIGNDVVIVGVEVFSLENIKNLKKLEEFELFNTYSLDFICKY